MPESSPRAESPASGELIQPPPVQMNVPRIVAVGTGAFFLVFLALLPCYGWLGRHHHHSWLWTSLAGGVLGILGWSLMIKHRHEGRTL